MTMPLQSSLPLLRRSPNPFLLLRMCLVLLQPLPAHMCKFVIQHVEDILFIHQQKQKRSTCFGTRFFVNCDYRESVQACALCNCVERSLHGQRELRHFGPSSDWLTLKPSASPLPQPGNDDLSSIGFSDSPCVASLFDDSG